MIARLWHLRAQALIGLGRADEADTILNQALASAQEHGHLALLWRILFGQTFHGRDGFTTFMQGFKGAFPDIRISLTNQVATDDQVVSEFTARGTHTGPLQTPAGAIPATGRTVDFIVCEVMRIKNGLIASLHNYQDAASIMRQLGLVL